MWKIVSASASLCFVGAGTAEPCTIPILEHKLDPKEQQFDKARPSQVAAKVVRLVRGNSGDSCEGLGVIGFEILRAEDDRTPREKLGYRFRIAEGSVAPRGWATFSQDRVNPNRVHVMLPGKTIFSFWWRDEGADQQEPIDFEVTITAVDLAGNEGPPSAPIRINHPGVKKS